MAKREFTGVNKTLPTCRLAYPQVFEKKFNDLKKKDEWSVTMLFSKDTDISPLKQAIVTAAKNEFGPEVDLNTLDLKRIQDGDGQKPRGGEYGADFKNCWVVKAATRLKAPGVVDAQRQSILDPTEIYSGVYANVNVTVKAYTKPNQGVTIYLNHVQKVKDGERIGGGPAVKDVFEEMDMDVSDAQAPIADTDMDACFS